MADIKFSCPHCQQHIQADTGYAGMQINCPACNGSMMVPGTPATAAPPPPPPPPPAPAPTPTAAPSQSSSSGCPSCGAVLPRGAVLCTKCGYNMATGKRMVAGKPVKPGKPAKDQWEVPWYKTAFPYIGLVLVVLGALYFLGKDNPGMKLAFIGVAALYCFVVHIIVAITAFRDNIGSGFLALCIPLYALYYVFRVNEDDTLKMLYGFAFVLNIALRFIN